MGLVKNFSRGGPKIFPFVLGHIGAFSFLQEISRGKLILQKCLKSYISGCYGTHFEVIDNVFKVLNSF